MSGRDGPGGEELQREIAVRDTVDGVGRRPVELERGGGLIAIDGKGGSGQRRGAQGAFVETLAAIRQAPAVAPDHLDIGQHVVPEGHRLGRLQVGVARHDRIGVRLGLVDQRGLQVRHSRVELVDGVAHPEAEVGRDLIVARAGGVQTAGRLARDLLEARFDIHMNVLERARKVELAMLDFAGDSV